MEEMNGGYSNMELEKVKVEIFVPSSQKERQ